ncbi:MAG: hypothetical protein WAL63_00300 [Solirubrobacteraceae bacterium]
MQVRRAIAFGALLVIVLLIALGVHSCQVSARNSSLQDYTDNVSSLITQSNQTGTRLFDVLSTAAAANNPPSVQNSVNETLHTANTVVSRAKKLNVPDEVKNGNQTLLRALQMRADGISNIASEIQPALGTSVSTEAINSIAAEMARFYASDVLYKDYAAPEIYGAMHSAGIRFAGLPAGQFVPDVQWTLPTYVATQLHASVPGSTTVAPGLHGHELNSVSVAGTTLQTGSANTIPASPAPTFTLTFTNTGTNSEHNVVCKVSVNGSSVSGQTTVPTTTPGKPATCAVKLSSTPPSGTQTVVATIEKVPGEKHLENNSMSFPVTFQ